MLYYNLLQMHWIYKYLAYFNKCILLLLFIIFQYCATSQMKTLHIKLKTVPRVYANNYTTHAAL